MKYLITALVEIKGHFSRAHAEISANSIDDALLQSNKALQAHYTSFEILSISLN